jgi:hypothetical protein
MRTSTVAVLAAPVLAAALAAVLLAPGAGPRPARAGNERRPVVVELFTSEGCSSCPPADAVLDRLARDQPVAGAEVIALELHVDYWNGLGWADPFSQASFSERQRAYADAFGQRGVYTPQMVVGGRRELVGSDERGARDAIAEAAGAPSLRVQASRTGDRLEIVVGDAEGAPLAEPAGVWLAVTEDGLSTRVPRGENAGATLAHGPVVRDLRRIASLAAGARGPVSIKDVEVRMDPAWIRDHVRAAVLVQRDGTRAILGGASVAMR